MTSQRSSCRGVHQTSSAKRHLEARLAAAGSNKGRSAMPLSLCVESVTAQGCAQACPRVAHTDTSLSTPHKPNQTPM